MEKLIILNDVLIKLKSKREVYYVLNIECRLYLPPLMDSNKGYLIGIMNCKKKSLYCKNILVATFPQIKSLSIKEILTFGKKNTNIAEYLWTYNYNKLPNRE